MKIWRGFLEAVELFSNRSLHFLIGFLCNSYDSKQLLLCDYSFGLPYVQL